jgi:3-hydroxyisobutyrate dehydrogenase-like beta-hydroxyacid dehydrogenase
MAETIAVIAMGEMGSAVGRRLHERGATVITQLTGRSAASAERAAKAGIVAVANDAELVARADFLLSIVPPGDAVALAQRLAPALTASAKKPVYVDCNAVSPQTAEKIGAVLASTGCTYVDAGIIGPAVGPNTRTIFYASGPGATEFERLSAYGLSIRVMDGPNGAASAMKLSYAGITKGLTAIGTAMILGATRGGTADALRQELSESQPQLLPWIRANVSRMPPKAYRWVAEMEEIAKFLEGNKPAQEMFLGIADLYSRLAKELDEAPPDGGEIGDLQDFCAGTEAPTRKSA